MTRLIDADLLEKEIYKWMPKDQETWMDSDIPPIENLVVSIMMTIQEQPTVDAVPVRYGKWNCGDDMFEYAICSACKWDSGEAWEYAKKYFIYCPNCGTRMDAEVKDNG